MLIFRRGILMTRKIQIKRHVCMGRSLSSPGPMLRDERTLRHVVTRSHGVQVEAFSQIVTFIVDANCFLKVRVTR